MTTDERTTMASSTTFPEHFGTLNLESGSENNERERMKRKRRYNQLSRDEEDDDASMAIDQEFMTLATDCIEFASKKRKIQEQLTSTFVTNIIELNHDVISRLKGEPVNLKQNIEAGAKPINLTYRFIRPSKNFYNKLISTWLKFDQSRLANLTFREF
jgi:hypothetical protein